MPYDREYWERKKGIKKQDIDFLEEFYRKIDERISLSFTSIYIGTKINGKSKNFALVHNRGENIIVETREYCNITESEIRKMTNKYTKLVRWKGPWAHEFVVPEHDFCNFLPSIEKIITSCFQERSKAR